MQRANVVLHSLVLLASMRSRRVLPYSPLPFLAFTFSLSLRSPTDAQPSLSLPCAPLSTTCNAINEI
jgi:hypothetical protein